MKIFKILNEEGFELAQPVLEDDFALLNSTIDGTPRGDAWTPVPMKIISKEKRRRTLRRADAPWLSSNILILRPQAAEAMRPLLASYGELLPLACEQTELAAFNAFNIIDALDENASVVERFDDGRIWIVDKYMFHRAAIQDAKIFKITSLRPSPLFIGEEFVERWRAAGLEGLDFKQVWEG